MKPPKKTYFNMHVIQIEPDSSQTDDQVEINNNLEDNPSNHSQTHQFYRHPPFFMVFISLFQLITFVYYALRAEDPITSIGPVPFGSKLIYNPRRRYEIWRYLTYGVIHAGYWHLIFNLLIQLAVGIPLEIVHEFKAIFIIYIGGIISGSLGNSIADPHSYLAGSSSGCYALIAAHMSNLIINWRTLKDENPAFKLTSLTLFGLTDMAIAVYERYYKPGSIGWHTSYAGHLAGAASGFLLGLMFLKRYRSNRLEQITKRVAKFTFYTLIVSNFKYPKSYIISE